MRRILRTWLRQTTPGLRAVAIAVLLIAPVAYGQAASAASAASSQTALDILHQLSDKADVIFAGQVLAIRPNNGVVEVEFRIDQGSAGALQERLTLCVSGRGCGWPTISVTASGSVC